MTAGLNPLLLADCVYTSLRRLTCSPPPRSQRPDLGVYTSLRRPSTRLDICAYAALTSVSTPHRVYDVTNSIA